MDVGARLRLIIVWGLFAGWVGWLGWQSFRHARFPVVSRAQLLEARLVVVADLVADGEGRAMAESTIVETIWSASGEKRLEGGSKLSVQGLAGCAGMTGAGRYVLPMSSLDPPRLAGFPRSPLVEPGKFRPQVYPDRPEVRQQIDEFFRGR